MVAIHTNTTPLYCKQLSLHGAKRYAVKACLCKSIGSLLPMQAFGVPIQSLGKRLVYWQQIRVQRRHRVQWGTYVVSQTV